MIGPPAFWHRPGHPLERILAPAGWAVGAIAARRMARPPAHRAGVPVICIGNFVTGGQGKTPLALAVADMLEARGRAPVFLSRGYGGRLAGPVRVTLDHSAEDVGDEPLLLHQRAPCIVSRDRIAGASLAEELGRSSGYHDRMAIVMDDGFQNPTLHKTLSLIAVDAGTGFGNGRVLPAGPLRAPLAAQWRDADAIVLIGDGAASRDVEARTRSAHKRLLRADLEPASGIVTPGERIVAFAGIGRPEKFFATLQELGAELVETHAYPDHHRFTRSEAERLVRSAERHGARLLTTQKDKVRLNGPELARLDEHAAALPVRLVLSGGGPDDLAVLFASHGL